MSELQQTTTDIKDSIARQPRTTSPSDNFINCVIAIGGILTQPQHSPVTGLPDLSCAAVRTSSHDRKILATTQGEPLAAATQNSFTAISPVSIKNTRRPPVFAPLLLTLFDAFPDAKYIFFSDRASLVSISTSRRVSPKFPTISTKRLLKAAQPDPEGNIAINIQGGGFVVAATTIEFLQAQKARIRPVSRLHP